MKAEPPTVERYSVVGKCGFFGQPRHRAGFTMIELLAVVAVGSLLFVIGAAGLQGVLQRTKDAETISDLRQIGTLVAQYAADHNGHVVPGKTAAPALEQWQVLLARLYHDDNVEGIWNLVDLTGNAPRIRREFSIFSPAYYRLPANYWDTGYGINMLPILPGSWVANTGEDWGEFARLFRQAEITERSKRPLVFPWPAWNAYSWDASWAYEAMLSPSGKFHVLYFDGHVGSLGRNDRETFQQMLEDPSAI